MHITLHQTKHSLNLDAAAVGDRPLSLHVYRVGGFWGDDKIVRAEDRKTPRYYLKGTRLAASWQFALHLGGSPHGEPICHVKSPYLGPPVATTDPGPISVSMIAAARPVGRDVDVGGQGGSSGAVLVERQTIQVPVFRGNFRGFDDVEYRWQPSSKLWGNRMECLDSLDQVVATYRITLFARSKDGELRIHQPARSMTDLIVATCLAMRTPDH